MKKIVLKLFQMQCQIKVLHWQTNSRSEHITFGDFYDDTLDIVDRLVEAIQGKYGKFTFGGIDSVQISDYSNLKFNVFLLDMETFFRREIYSCGVTKENDPEIDNIIQELLEQIDKMKYLLSFN